MAYSVPDLPYDFGALEPHIDARTMEIHHDKHHAAYVTNLNAALEGTEWMDRPIDAVLANLEILPEDKRMAVRNNGGGHANHSLFWETMSADGGGEPAGALADAIAETFGSLDELKALVNDAGVKRFGSGWTWLVWDGTGLAVYSTANQDSPVMQSDVPLLGIDVWEHAYYLNYQNRRPDYLAAWWNVVDWDAVASRFGAV
jgi:superoxide dismutase, Fe-Mn family